MSRTCVRGGQAKPYVRMGNPAGVAQLFEAPGQHRPPTSTEFIPPAQTAHRPDVLREARERSRGASGALERHQDTPTRSSSRLPRPQARERSRGAPGASRQASKQAGPALEEHNGHRLRGVHPACPGRTSSRCPSGGQGAKSRGLVAGRQVGNSPLRARGPIRGVHPERSRGASGTLDEHRGRQAGEAVSCLRRRDVSNS